MLPLILKIAFHFSSFSSCCSNINFQKSKIRNSPIKTERFYPSLKKFNIETINSRLRAPYRFNFSVPLRNFRRKNTFTSLNRFHQTSTRPLYVCTSSVRACAAGSFYFVVFLATMELTAAPWQHIALLNFKIYIQVQAQRSLNDFSLK